MTGGRENVQVAARLAGRRWCKGAGAGWRKGLWSRGLGGRGAGGGGGGLNKLICWHGVTSDSTAIIMYMAEPEGASSLKTVARHRRHIVICTIQKLPPSGCASLSFTLY